MYGKIEITGKIRLITGLHIGGSVEFSAIGAIDSPVIKDVISNDPFIPGSSLKGKLRYLLQRQYQRNIDVSGRHENDEPEVLRLFGSTNTNEENRISRLYFSDAFISNKKDLEKIGIESITEVKFENSINRFTAVANPRQIERVIRGSKFDLEIIYNIQNEEEVEEDFERLKEAFKLLEFDYLGGSGSRGYGRVKIEDIEINMAVGDYKNIEKLREIMGEIWWSTRYINCISRRGLE